MARVATQPQSPVWLRGLFKRECRNKSVAEENNNMGVEMDKNKKQTNAPTNPTQENPTKQPT